MRPARAYPTDVSIYRRFCSVQVVARFKHQGGGGSCAVRFNSVVSQSKNLCAVSIWLCRVGACDRSSPLDRTPILII